MNQDIWCNRLVRSFRKLVLLCMVIVLLATTSGCATFTEVGTRTVNHQEIRENPVSQTLVRYHAPLAIQFPSAENPTLVLKIEGEVDIAIRYRTPTHQERILRRRVTEFQDALEDCIANVDDDDPIYALFNLISIPIVIGFAPLNLMLGFHEETIYELIPGSESSFVHFKHETATIAASSILVGLSGIGTAKTDSDGLVRFSVHCKCQVNFPSVLKVNFPQGRKGNFPSPWKGNFLPGRKAEFPLTRKTEIPLIIPF